MASETKPPVCEWCGRRSDGRPLCEACGGGGERRGGRGTLRRLFRIRPRRSADGKTVIFERYEG